MVWFDQGSKPWGLATSLSQNWKWNALLIQPSHPVWSKYARQKTLKLTYTLLVLCPCWWSATGSWLLLQQLRLQTRTQLTRHVTGDLRLHCWWSYCSTSCSARPEAASVAKVRASWAGCQPAPWSGLQNPRRPWKTKDEPAVIASSQFHWASAAIASDVASLWYHMATAAPLLERHLYFYFKSIYGLWQSVLYSTTRNLGIYQPDNNGHQLITGNDKAAHYDHCIHIRWLRWSQRPGLSTTCLNWTKEKLKLKH